MKRKSKKKQHEWEDNVAVMMLKTTWLAAAETEVCPLCLVYAMAGMVKEAEDKGHIEHGIMPKPTAGHVHEFRGMLQ